MLRCISILCFCMLSVLLSVSAFTAQLRLNSPTTRVNNRKIEVLSSKLNTDRISLRKSMQMAATDYQTEVVTVVRSNEALSSPNPTQYELSPQQFIYVVLSCLFVTCLLIGDVIGVKLFNIPLPFPVFGVDHVEHSCGMLTFPITFILGDVINEYYGAKAAKRTVFIGLAMSILVFIVMNVAQALPYLDKPFNVSQESFDNIFGSAKVMYIASVTAYLLGSLSDIWLFGVIKKATQGKYLWLRATGSTVISQILDSFVVSYVAFSLGKIATGQTPASVPEVLQIASTGYGLKFFLSTSLTPVLYAIKGVLKDKYNLQSIPLEGLLEEEAEDASVSEAALQRKL